MKKIILILLTLIGFSAVAEENSESLLASPTFTKIVRNNRGLFGYKYVTENPSSGGDVYLLCADPGKWKCQLSAALVVSGDLDNEELSTIQDMVDQLILDNSGAPGNFTWNTDYYVSYTFNLSTGESEIEILTRAEADERNITF